MGAGRVRYKSSFSSNWVQQPVLLFLKFEFTENLKVSKYTSSITYVRLGDISRAESLLWRNMKRNSIGSSSPQRGSDAKRARLSSPDANRFSVLSSPDEGKQDTDGEWTRVEKRKQKKTKHVEAKLSVSLVCLSYIWH